MASAYTFQCPNCGSSVSAHGPDKEVTCQYCGSTVIVPKELREQPAPAAPANDNFGQSVETNDEIMKTIGTVGKVTAGVTVASFIFPVVLTCVILGAVGVILFFVFSNVKTAVQGSVFPTDIASSFNSQPTLAPTATSLPIDTPVPFTKTLFKDSFAKTGTGWDVKHTSNYTLEYKGGKYHIAIDKNFPGEAVWNGNTDGFTDISVEVDAQQTAGPNDALIGVACRANDNGGMYTFEFDESGDVGIYKYDTNGNASSLAEESLNPNTVVQGDVNHIQGVCDGDTLTMVLNGQPVLSAQDSDYTTGGAGLIVRSGSSGDQGVDALFGNFLVKGP